MSNIRQYWSSLTTCKYLGMGAGPWRMHVLSNSNDLCYLSSQNDVKCNDLTQNMKYHHAENRHCWNNVNKCIHYDETSELTSNGQQQNVSVFITICFIFQTHVCYYMVGGEGRYFFHLFLFCRLCSFNTAVM